MLAQEANSVAQADANQQTTVDSDNVTDIEVINITGDFRDANIQKIPTAVSLIGEAEIERRHAQNLEEVLALSPNVNFSSGSQRARYFQIRGIGERSQFSEPINPSVGVIIDDIEFSGIASGSSLFDVAQVEIFRGPQGTRFGASALAGVINIQTNNPTETFEGSVKALLGNFDSKALGLVLSGPATEKVNYRLAVEKYESDGFIDNIHLNRDDVNNRDELTVRGKLAIEATEDLSINLSLVHINFDNGYDAFSLDENRTTFSDEPGFDRQQTNAVSARFNYEGFEKFDLLAIATLARSNLGYAFDEDWSFGQYDDNTGECLPGIECLDGAIFGYSSFDNYTREKDNETLEFRATSKPGAEIFNQSTTWVAGIYYKDELTDLERIYTFDDDFTSSFEAQTLAAYAEFATSFSDELTLTTGIRIEERQTDYSNSNGFTDDPTDTIVGGKIVLSHQTDDRLIYGSINRGYKAGGVNTDGTLSDGQRAFEPEFVINYELGYKTTYFDDAVSFRAAIFYMDRKDVQVSISEQLAPEAGQVVGEFVSFIENASEGENFGLEIETTWQVSDTVDIYASLGLLETEYKAFSFTSEDGEVSLSGREQAHAPSYQFNVGVNYYITERLLWNVSVNGKDAFFFSDSHDEESDAYELLNTSLTYTEDNWDVSLWGRNITDRDYAVRGFFFGNDPRNGYEATNYTQLGEPAVFGATFNYHF